MMLHEALSQEHTGPTIGRQVSSDGVGSSSVWCVHLRWGVSEAVGSRRGRFNMLSWGSAAVGRVDSSDTLIGCVLAMPILIGGTLSESARCVGGTEVTTVNKR